MRVPRFDPFPAARYAPTLPLDVVTAPPYDVLSVDQVMALRARHPANITHVDVPLETDGSDRYAVAADHWRRWLTDGTLVVDGEPSYTLYRMRFTDSNGVARSTVGVLGALEVVDEGGDGVLPHERTTPKATTDRLDLTRATSANLSPVWGLSLTAGLTDLLAEPGEPVGVCHDEHGVEHRFERVVDPRRVDAIRTAVASSPVLIADGHHRYSISRTYRDEQRRLGATGDAESTLAYVAELVDSQLSIDAIHRVYTGPAALQLGEALAAHFDLEPAGPVGPETTRVMGERGALCLVDRHGNGQLLTAKPGAFSGVRALDGAWLEAALDGVAVDVGYQHGVSEVLELLRSGTADAAVLIRPTSIDEIRRTADERLLMPPKSTFFTPKLRTGVVMRPLR